MAKPLPILDREAPVADATRKLAQRNPAVLVRDDGRIVGILTRYDVLEFITE